jgi:hypothetical protein
MTSKPKWEKPALVPFSTETASGASNLWCNSGTSPQEGCGNGTSPAGSQQCFTGTTQQSVPPGCANQGSTGIRG